MNKRTFITLAILLASVFCFTQIAPGFLHHHCSEQYITFSGEHDHSAVSVLKDLSPESTTLSDRCLICASHGVPHLYLHHLAISVIPAERFEAVFFYHTFSYTASAESGTSRAPPFGLV